MAEPSYAIQKAVFEALIAANISGVGAKVYHRVPATAVLSYLEIGNDQIISDDTSGDYFDCFIEVQAFAASKATLKVIVAAIYGALWKNLSVDGFTFHEFHHRSTRYLTEEIGSDLIENAIMEFEYKIQVAD